MFATVATRMAQPAKESILQKALPIAASNNICNTKAISSPDLKQLTHHRRLRFEKKNNRNFFLAGRSPSWDRAIKYAQLVTVIGRHYIGHHG